ncbi:MAG TPA: ABC transporter ATP-binding protein [Patescibacteria group bacterium]
MFAIKNFSKAFLDLEVLKNLSLSVEEHEFVSLIGPSGCGKSTLFNILAGVDQADSGEIVFNQQKIKQLKGKFGYMPQEASLLPWKKVLENVMLGPTVLNKNKKLAKDEALKLLQKFDLAAFADFYPHALSGGMQQRVALLRTVLFNPDFLLLDEPFGSLDALTRHEAQMWLLTVCQNFKSSVLFVTHDIQEAILLSDRIYVMSARPSFVVQEIKVGLPRPRKLTDLTKPEAVNLEKKLLTLLTKA